VLGTLPALDDEIFISPTQWGEFQLCKRKWGLKNIGKVSTPQHASAALGERVHKLLEAWLEHGTIPDDSTVEGAIAVSGIQHCPSPKTVLVEQWITVPMKGYTWRGRADVMGPELEPPLIHDHKTTADMKWAKSEAELLTDVQAVVYAFALMLRLPGGPRPVRVQFLFMQTKGARKARLVSVVLTPDDIEREMARIDVVAQEIVRTRRTVTDPLTLPPSIDACSAFGGCHYATSGHCDLSPSDYLHAREKQAEMATVHSMLAGLNVNPPAPPPLPPVSSETPLEGAPPQSAAPLAASLAAAPPIAPAGGLLAALTALGPPPAAGPPPPPPAPAAPGLLALLGAQAAAPPPPPPAAAAPPPPPPPPPPAAAAAPPPPPPATPAPTLSLVGGGHATRTTPRIPNTQEVHTVSLETRAQLVVSLLDSGTPAADVVAEMHRIVGEL
ncbi:MAG: PD-(D/E)XK nuclease family protein, partial [Gemmatimonadaceae bacterium]|nr:PD-(D/E)XK nuclease family protein [Gemmatimonadaceae bacterium]